MAAFSYRDVRYLADDRQNDDIDARLAAAQAGQSEVKAPNAKGYGQGSRVLTELIAVPIGGGLLGWALDRWLGTSPWLLLVLFALAVVVAFRNIIRISNERPE